MGDERVTEAPPDGEVLRRERLRRRLSLIDVGQRTKIHPRLLEAMENGDDRSLPAPVFAVGLMTTYARFLGVDPAPIVQAYRSRVAVAQKLPRTYRVPRGIQLPGLALPSAVVGVAVALALYLYQQYAAYVTGAAFVHAPPMTSAMVIPPTPRARADLPLLPPTPTSRPTPVVTPTAVQRQTSSLPPIPPIPTPVATPPPTATPTVLRAVKIDAKATARVWVQVQADDRVIFSGILMAGDTRAWTAKQKLMVWAGNGGSVIVTFDGKPLGPIGRPGEVVKVTWTASP